VKGRQIPYIICQSKLKINKEKEKKTHSNTNGIDTVGAFPTKTIKRERNLPEFE
jgi:hypothetical protein